MSDLVGNPIVGFLTPRLIYNYHQYMYLKIYHCTDLTHGRKLVSPIDCQSVVMDEQYVTCIVVFEVAVPDVMWYHVGVSSYCL